MRVFISADMEGATGVCHRDHLLAGGQDYERARHWLTSDLNAAIEGACDAGATEIVVADGHATMRNVLLDELDPRAQLLCGPAQVQNRPLAQLGALGPDTFDCAMFVGYHTRAGTPGGLLAHTWVGSLVHEIRMNGVASSEARLNAALLGEFGIPVVLATGADDFAAQVREELGDDLEAIAVKRTLGPSAVVTQSLKNAAKLIRAGATRAMKSTRPVFRVSCPVEFEVEFHRRQQRDQAAEFGGERRNDRVLVFQTETVEAGVERVWRALTNALRSESGFLR